MFEYIIKEVNKIVDGDTLDITIDLGFSILIKQRIRLEGIDAPETFTKDEVEKTFGNEAKDFVVLWVSSGNNFTVKTFKDDKYGRILARLYKNNDSESLNEQMIRKGYAWEYSDVEKRTKNFSLLLERRKASQLI